MDIKDTISTLALLSSIRATMRSTAPADVRASAREQLAARWKRRPVREWASGSAPRPASSTSTPDLIAALAVLDDVKAKQDDRTAALVMLTDYFDGLVSTREEPKAAPAKEAASAVRRAPRVTPMAPPRRIAPTTDSAVEAIERAARNTMRALGRGAPISRRPSAFVSPGEIERSAASVLAILGRT